jgi:DNA-binding response OmpR family regulator
MGTPPALPRILCIDDDDQNLAVLREVLVGRFEAETFNVPLEGLKRASTRRFSLILIDIDMPGMNGFEVCEGIRSTGPNMGTPVIFLTSDSQSVSMQKALRAGGSDYLLKPFRVQELLTRIEFRLGLAHVDSPIRCGNLSLDPAQLTATIERRGKITTYRLTRRSFEVVQVLMKNEGRLLSRDQLLDLAWEESSGASDRAVDLHVFRLRKLLRDWTYEIETVYGKGYTLSQKKRA